MRNTTTNDEGFTMIELLVVILVIGILSAIALPSFLGQREKGQDTDAKANARNLVSQVESCYATEQDYAACDDANLPETGLPVGTGPGQVTASASGDGYVVTAASKSGGTFRISRSDADSAITRSCSGGTAGCRGATW